MPWNLFETQPLLLFTPNDDMIACAAVSPIQGGIIWWNADYLLCQGQTGMPGPGFGANPVDGVLRFNKKELAKVLTDYVINQITYDNFKSAQEPGNQPWHDFLMKVWAAGHHIQK